jgi:hypothetical protein
MFYLITGPESTEPRTVTETSEAVSQNRYFLFLNYSVRYFVTATKKSDK